MAINDQILKINGEAGGVDENVVSLWFGDQLKSLIVDVDPQSLFITEMNLVFFGVYKHIQRIK